VDAPQFTIARIVSAEIVICTIGSNTASAKAFGTVLTDGAGIAVVAGNASVCGGEVTGSRRRLTHSLQAGRIRAVGVGAKDHTLLHYPTGIWPLSEVAIEGSIAKIAIL